MARRYRSNVRVSVDKEHESWNYHDDAWSSYESLSVEKLSRSEFERSVAELASASDSPTDDSDHVITRRIGQMAKQCYEQPQSEASEEYEASEAYMTGFEKISGYYRFYYYSRG